MPNRCAWARDELSIAYHDAEWGVPLHDDRALFELLILEGAQAGLSWITILKKRPAYRKAFGSKRGLLYCPALHFQDDAPAAPTVASFKINRKVVNADSFMMRGIFNTVDLPSSLLNLAVSIKINGTFVVNGIIGTENTIQNPTNSTKPS